MKRKLILMAMALTSAVAFSNFSVEANAAMNDEKLAETKAKIVEYLNNYSTTNNVDTSETTDTTNDTDFNLSDYVNNAGSSYEDVVDDVIESLPEVTLPEESTDDTVTPDVSEDTGSTESGLINPFIIDNLLRIVNVGESYTINLVSSPGEVVFSSSNPEVATVDENGNVVAVAPGKAYITVSTVDGCRTRKAVVRVKEKTELPDIDIDIDIEKPDIDKPDINFPDIEFPDINIGGNKPSINWPSVNWPSMSLPTSGSTTTGTLGNGYASKLSSTATTLSSGKGTSTSTLPNTGTPVPLEAIGAISLLGGLGLYKKRK